MQQHELKKKKKLQQLKKKKKIAPVIKKLKPHLLIWLKNFHTFNKIYVNFFQTLESADFPYLFFFDKNNISKKKSKKNLKKIKYVCFRQVIL